MKSTPLASPLKIPRTHGHSSRALPKAHNLTALFKLTENLRWMDEIGNQIVDLCNLTRSCSERLQPGLTLLRSAQSRALSAIQVKSDARPETSIQAEDLALLRDLFQRFPQWLQTSTVQKLTRMNDFPDHSIALEDGLPTTPHTYSESDLTLISATLQSFDDQLSQSSDAGQKSFSMVTTTSFTIQSTLGQALDLQHELHKKILGVA